MAEAGRSPSISPRLSAAELVEMLQAHRPSEVRKAFGKLRFDVLAAWAPAFAEPVQNDRRIRERDEALFKLGLTCVDPGASENARAKAVRAELLRYAASAAWARHKHLEILPAEDIRYTFAHRSLRRNKGKVPSLSLLRQSPALTKRARAFVNERSDSRDDWR